jgi:hypothetical protein
MTSKKCLRMTSEKRITRPPLRPCSANRSNAGCPFAIYGLLSAFPGFTVFASTTIIIRKGFPMSLNLNEQQKTIIETDYSRDEVSREAASKFPCVRRGSVRLVRDLYRTEAEEREFYERGLKVILPGEKGYKPKRLTFFAYLRRFFGA